MQAREQLPTPDYASTGNKRKTAADLQNYAFERLPKLGLLLR